MTNREYALKLREIARFYEDNAEIGQPKLPTMVFCSSKKEILKAAQIPGKKTKSSNDSFFYLHLEIGSGITLDFATSRATVCERKVVGTRIEPKVSYPERTVDVVEWKCLPLLDVADAPADDHVPF